MIKSATLRDVEKHITNCLRQNDIHTGLRLIVDHFHEHLYWAIRKWVLVHEDADDVLQLTYVRIYKGLGKFAFKSTVKITPNGHVAIYQLCRVSWRTFEKFKASISSFR